MAKQTFKRIDNVELLQHLEDLASRKIALIKSEFTFDHRLIEQQKKIKKLLDKLNVENKKLTDMLEKELKNNISMQSKNRIFLNGYMKFRNKYYD